MAYVKIIYQDSPSTATPLNAQNLNHMDDGIFENDRRLNDLAVHNVKSFNGREGDIVSAYGDYDISQIAPTTGATVGQIPIVVNVGTEEEPELQFELDDVPQTGHTIQGADGTNLAQEPTMQFADLHTSDDSVHLKTVIQAVKSVIQAEYSSETEDGIYLVTDGDGATIEPASDDYVEVTADGVKTYSTLLNELWAKIDMSKISHETSLMFYDYQRNTNDYYIITRKRNSNNYLYFICDTEWGSTTTAYIGAMKIASSGSMFMVWEIQSTASSTDISSSVPVSGTKITLYYGNKKATVDLQTTANRCWYDSNNTVKQKIDTKANLYRTTTSLPSISAGASATITIPFTATLVYNVQITAINSGLPFIASSYWADGTDLHIQVYAINATSGETVMVNVAYK